MFENEKKDEKKEESKNKNTRTRAFYLHENVNSSSIKSIIQGILEINRYDSEQEKKNSAYVREPITLVIDSYGGSIYDGMGLVGVIDTSITPVHGYCYSKSMSMGLATYVVCHKRFAFLGATFMYHDGATSLGGTAEQIQQSLNQTKRLVKMIDSLILQYTDINKRKLDNIKKSKQDFYMFAEEALELGIVDEILSSTRNLHRKQEA